GFEDIAEAFVFTRAVVVADGRQRVALQTAKDPDGAVEVHVAQCIRWESGLCTRMNDREAVDGAVAFHRNGFVVRGQWRVIGHGGEYPFASAAVARREQLAVRTPEWVRLVGHVGSP